MSESNTVSEFSRSGWSGRGSLAPLVAELERQRDTKMDFVADSRSLRVEVATSGRNDGGLVLRPGSPAVSEFVPSAGIPISDLALTQIGARVSPEVPGRFLSSLASMRPYRAAELLSGLFSDGRKSNLVRCLDGRVRAFLSDRYRILEHYDLLFGSLTKAKELGADVLEGSLNDKTMRVKLIRRDLWDVIDATRGGDKATWYAGGLGDKKYLATVSACSGGEMPGGPGTIHPVLTIGNSETGHGGMFARLGILHGVCFNLATVEDVVTQIHLGEKMEAGVFTAETVAAESKAIMLKARDAIGAAFDEKKFRAVVARMKNANEEEIRNPTLAVGNLVENAELSDEAKDSILGHFLRDYRPTRYGLAQAVARYAQEVPDGDDAGRIEDLSGKLSVENGEKLYA